MDAGGEEQRRVDAGPRRVVVVGAESTGTTTLVRALADRLDAPCTWEYLRAICERKAAANGGSFFDVEWSGEDFDEVADGQDALEEEAAATGAGPPEVLVCDTDALATALWHRRYLGTTPDHLLRRAAASPPDLYVLTSPEGVAFEQDGWRDGEHVRAEMHGWFRDALAAQDAPWVEVVGSVPDRVDAVLGLLSASGPPPR